LRLPARTVLRFARVGGVHRAPFVDQPLDSLVMRRSKGPRGQDGETLQLM
jgi:hypothetical protein